MSDTELWGILVRLDRLHRDGAPIGENAEKILAIVGDMQLEDITRSITILRVPGEIPTPPLDKSFLLSFLHELHGAMT